MNHFKYKLISALCLSTLALTGCNDDNTSNSTTSTTNVSGTAAVGAAITGANVVLNCGGSSTFNTTTNTNGVFNVTVPTANLPCAASISGGSLPAGQTLHSVTTTAGANVTVNVNPLTDLVLIKALQAGGVDAAAWLAHPVSTNLPTAAAITTASNAIKTALIAKGYTYPTTANFNPITSAITPASPTDTYDSLLDALAAAITTAGSTYPQLVTSFIGGGSFPTAPITPPAGGVTCASINKQKAALSDLTQFVGKYLVKIGSSTTTTSLTIAANGDISMNGKTATASDVCGPFVQNNGQGLLILAKNTADIQVNVFKDTAGKITTEGPDFTSASGDYFFGEKSNPTAVVDCESSGADDKLGFKNAPADFCSFSKSTSVAITSPDTYTFFNADKSENVKVTVEGTTVKSIAIENNSYAWACGIGTLTTCSGASFSASNNYKQIAFMNTTLDIVNGASKALIVKNGLLIHLATPVTPPVTPPTQVFSLNPAACTLLSTDADKTLYSQCHENVVQDMNLSLKTLSNAPCNLIKVGNTVSVTVGGNTIRDTYNADSEDLLQIINPTGSLSFLGNSLIVKTYGAVEISLSLNTNGTFKNVIATQTSPFSQFSCLL